MGSAQQEELNQSQSKLYGAISVHDVDAEHCDSHEAQKSSPGGPCAAGWQDIMQKLFPTGYWREFKGLAKITWPIMLTMLFQYISGPLAIIFCGHLGTIALDSVSLANTLISITCIAVATGLATASDTIFSQLYGSPNRRKMGVALQRSLYIMTLAVFPVWAIHLNADTLLKLIGEDEHVADYAQRYLEVFMPGVLVFFLYSVLAKYLQNQNIVIPNLIIGFISLVINGVLHYVLLYELKIGIIGSAIAQVVGYSCMFFFTLGYIVFTGIYKDTWDGWSWESLEDWGLFFKLALYGLFLGCLEWTYEIGVFLSGILGTTQLGAQTILYELNNIAYMLPTGTGIAASIRVGQFLGASDAEGAVTAAGVAVSITWGVTFIFAMITVAFRWQVPLIFTNVQDVISLVAGLIPVLGLCQFLSATMGVCCGVLRGCGRQNLGALLFFGYLIVMLPVTIPVMLLSGTELSGFWWSYAATLLLPTTAFIIVILKTNWQTQVQAALARTMAVEPKGIKRYHSIEQDDSFDDLDSADDSSSSAALHPNSSNHGNGHVRVSGRVIIYRCLTVLIMLTLFFTSLTVRLLVGEPDTHRRHFRDDNVTTSSPLYLFSQVTSQIRY